MSATQSKANQPTLYYDGSCGLCHRAVRFVVARDREILFRFAPLSSRAFANETKRPTDLTESVMLRNAKGQWSTRSTALIGIGRGLGGAWSCLANAFAVIPRPIRDAVYDFIARHRRKLFARPNGACPPVPAELRKRFLD